MSKVVKRYAIVATALFSVFSFPSFSNTVSTTYNLQSVERAHKGDRLSETRVATKGESHSSLLRAEKRVPFGCDRAFSSSSQFSTLFGRCLV
jgi:hypothetical protein